MLVSAAILGPFQGAFHARTRTAAVELTLSAERPGTVELYLDSGRGFNEAEVSRGTFLAGQDQHLRLPIPTGSYRKLRLDPTIVRDTVSIGDLAIVEPDGGRRIDLDVSLLRPTNGITDAHVDGTRLVVESSDDDPRLTFTPPQPIRVGPDTRLGAAVAMAAAFLVLTAALVAARNPVVTRLSRWSASSRRAAWLLFAMVAIIAPRLPWLDAPLLDWFSWRQTQTALTAYWFAAEGLSLPGYPLPVFGRPWTAPFEFPAYQMVAAGVHRLGVPLDAACRGLALTAFVACFAVLVWMLRRHGCPDFILVALWLFALATPFGLVWSKAALIEFFAVLAGLSYVAGACEMHARGPRPALVVALVALGVATTTIKITSSAVFLPACFLLAAHDLWSRTSGRVGTGRLAGAAAAWAAAIAMPVLAGLAWTNVADAIKDACPATEWLVSSRLGAFTYGTWTQRLEPRAWLTIGRRIHHDVLPVLWIVALYGVTVLARLPVRTALAALGMLAGSACAVATFFNLYVVHDYYLCAVAFPLWLAAAAGLYGLARRLASRGIARRLVLPAALAILVVATFRSPQVAGAFRDFTDHELLRFTREVQRFVPPGEEVIICGEAYNSRLPYYAERKALMVTRRVEDRYVTDYAARHGIRYFISAPVGRALLHRLFPDTEQVLRTESFELRRRGPAR